MTENVQAGRVSIWPPWLLHPARTAVPSTAGMTAASMLVIAPWAVFGATLIVLWLRLLKSRH